MPTVTCIAFGPSIEKHVEISSWDLLKLLFASWGVEVFLVLIILLILCRILLGIHPRQRQCASSDLANTPAHH